VPIRRDIEWIRVVVRMVNAEGVSEPRPQDEAELAFTRPGHFGLPDVWLFCEISWLRLAELAAKHGLHAIQDGERGTAEAGVGMASRRPIRQFPTIIGTRATREGGGIRARTLIGGRTFHAPWWVGHAPPGRSPIARAAFIAAALVLTGVIGCDWNRAVAWMKKTTGRRQYRGIGVLGMRFPRTWRVSAAWPVDVDSDHDGVDVEVWIPVKRKRRRRATA
jgi:hypothetical protein